MKEIEVKILDINVAQVEKQLDELNAEKTYDGDVDVIFYDYPDGRLHAEKKRLRLRDFGSKVELTFKEKKSTEKTKIAEELEVIVSDFAAAQKLIESMGLQEVKRYTKHRTSYRLGEIAFEIDTIPGYPSFMEVEAPTEKKVFEWVEKLGFSKKEAKPWTGSKVIEYYKEGEKS